MKEIHTPTTVRPALTAETRECIRRIARLWTGAERYLSARLQDPEYRATYEQIKSQLNKEVSQ